MNSSDLLQRTLSGAGFIGFVVACLFLGPVGLACFTFTAALICTLEFAFTARKAGYKPVTELLMLGSFALLFLAYQFRAEPATCFTLVFAVIWFATLSSLVVMLAIKPTSEGLLRMAFTPFWLVYFALPLVQLQLLQGTVAQHHLLTSERWPAAVSLLLIFVTVWGSDVFAYLFGSKFGKRKLAPSISPKKTWVGLVASWAGALACGTAGAIGLGGDWRAGLTLGVIVAVMAPLGDLAASWLKRCLKAKDFGHTLPGHGGLLDRLDALLFVLPAVYWLMFNPFA